MSEAAREASGWAWAVGLVVCAGMYKAPSGPPLIHADPPELQLQPGLVGGNPRLEIGGGSSRYWGCSPAAPDPSLVPILFMGLGQSKWPGGRTRSICNQRGHV